MVWRKALCCAHGVLRQCTPEQVACGWSQCCDALLGYNKMLASAVGRHWMAGSSCQQVQQGGWCP